jgi:hypothetical protein
MEYNNIIEILLKEFPELIPKYEEDKFFLKNLPHSVFELIFVEYFIELFSKESDEIKFTQVADFIEKMFICSDNYVKGVALVSVLESLLPERYVLEKARQYFGEKTKENLDELEEKYGWKKLEEK